MDKLDTWAVQGRVATAIRNVRESAAQLAVDSAELVEAVAEAERLAICAPAPSDVRNGWSFQSVGTSVEWLLPSRAVQTFDGNPETA